MIKVDGLVWVNLMCMTLSLSKYIFCIYNIIYACITGRIHYQQFMYHILYVLL